MKQTNNSSIKNDPKRTAKRVSSSKDTVKQELRVKEKKDNIYATTSFVCGLLFWVPLFNWVLGPMAIIFGIFALKYARNEPQRYGGETLAVIGIILGAISVIFTILGLYITIFHPELIGFNNTVFKP